jgi:transcriptional repressor NrdR
MCDAGDTRVVDSRPSDGGAAIRRRRECGVCGHRFTTYERASIVHMVRKRDGRREPYDAKKVVRGLQITLADRPVSEDQIAEIVSAVDDAARASGKEIGADEIGGIVLEGLRDIDEVAYLRFASVHKEFQGASDFHRAMEALEEDDAEVG